LSGTIAPSMRKSGGEPVVMCMSLAPFSIMARKSWCQIDLKARFGTVHWLFRLPDPAGKRRPPNQGARARQRGRYPAGLAHWHTGELANLAGNPRLAAGTDAA